jgi:hypothetical protein
MDFMNNTALIASYGRLLHLNSRFMKMLSFIPGGVIFVLVLAALSVAQEPASQPPSPLPLMLSPADKGKVIYVRDFEVDPGAFKQDKGGIAGKGFILPPPPGLMRRSQDPAKEAQKLIRLTSESLVANLEKAGLKARRLSASDPRPKDGLLLTGVFTQMSEGNHVRRALIGFGSGAAKMELIVTVAHASQPYQPLYDVVTEKTSGRKPGAAIILNPYVSVAKFVLTKNAPEKTVKKTAAKIADELAKQLNWDTQIAKK